MGAKLDMGYSIGSFEAVARLSLMYAGWLESDRRATLPLNVAVTGRFPIASKLYQLPGHRPNGKRGPKPKKGALLGTAGRHSAKTLVVQPGWQPHKWHFCMG